MTTDDGTIDAAAGRGADDRTAELLAEVLDDLAGLMARLTPDTWAASTPCTEYDVAALRAHALGWLTFFAAALTDPDGSAPRPDPQAPAPDTPREAEQAVRRAADAVAAAVADGVADRPVLVVKATLPGRAVLGMMLGEYVTHGWDLARAAGLPWDPPGEAAELGREILTGMLTDEYRGEGKDFGPQVPVPDDAPALDRYLGFAGRDPAWTPGG